MALGVALLVVLVVLALGLAVMSMWLVMPLRRRVDHLSADVNSLQVALEEMRSELNDLRAAAQAVPAPPLPRTRSGDLDDLRQRLRAAHREADTSEE